MSISKIRSSRRAVAWRNRSQWPTIDRRPAISLCKCRNPKRARFAVLTSEDFGVGYELFQRLPTLPDELFEHSAHRSVRAADVRHRSVPAPLHSFVFAMSLVVATSRFGAVFSLYALMKAGISLTWMVPVVIQTARRSDSFLELRASAAGRCRGRNRDAPTSSRFWSRPELFGGLDCGRAGEV